MVLLLADKPFLLALAILLPSLLVYLAPMCLILVCGLLTIAGPQKVSRFIAERVGIQLLILLVLVALLIWLGVNYGKTETDVRTHVVM
jgi:hypothetical protein